MTFSQNALLYNITFLLAYPPLNAQEDTVLKQLQNGEIQKIIRTSTSLLAVTKYPPQSGWLSWLFGTPPSPATINNDNHKYASALEELWSTFEEQRASNSTIKNTYQFCFLKKNKAFPISLTLSICEWPRNIYHCSCITDMGTIAGFFTDYEEAWRFYYGRMQEFNERFINY